MAVRFPTLPFALNALEPYISQKTMEFHHNKHHRHYVDTLNELITGTSLEKKDLIEIMRASCKRKPKIFINAAQSWNHEFLWNCLDRLER